MLSVWLLLAFIPAAHGVPAYNELPPETYIVPGDIYIGVLQIIHTYSDTSMCSSQLASMKYQQNVPAAIYQVASINSNENLLQNITLGLVQMDCCSKPVTAVGQALTILDDRLKTTNRSKGTENNRKIIGMIGPLPSVVSMAVSSVFNLYRTPIISSTASSDELTDRSKYRYLYRMVPPDSFQAKVMVDLLVHYNWSYISVVHEENTYGFNGLKFIRRLTSANDICIAESHALADSFVDEDFDDLVERLRFHKKARVVVVFALTHKMRAFIQAVYRRNTTEFILVLSETATRDSFRGVESVLQGSFSVQWFIGSMDADMEAYIAGTSPETEPNNPWIEDVWKQYLSCDNVHTPPCSGYLFGDVPAYFRYPTIYQLAQGIQAYALALDALINERCPYSKQDKSILADCVDPEYLLDYLGKVVLATDNGDLVFTDEGAMIRDYQLQQLQFHEGSGLYSMVPVGLWTHSQKKLAVNETSMKWRTWRRTGDSALTVPQSVCATPCDVGEFYIQGELPCCWDCHRCRSNEYVADNATTCRTCPILTWPDQETITFCLPIEPNYLNWLHIYALILMGLTAVGVVFNTVVLVITIHYRHRRVIKGAILEIVAIILTGLFMALATVPLFIAKPNPILCILNRIGFHLSCTLIYGPLMVKTNRVYQVFAAAAKLSRAVRYATRTSQIVAIIVTIGIQIGICTTALILWPVKAALTMPVRTEKYVELSCEQSLEGLLSPLGFNFALLLICSTFAFLTRKLPDNFNESWYIFLSVSTTLFVWMAFLPTYFAAFYAYHKAVLLALAIILSSFVSMVCQFVPKLYALFYVDEKDIQITNFSMASFSDNRQSKYVAENGQEERDTRNGHDLQKGQAD